MLIVVDSNCRLTTDRHRFLEMAIWSTPSTIGRRRTCGQHTTGTPAKGRKRLAGRSRAASRVVATRQTVVPLEDRPLVACAVVLDSWGYAYKAGCRSSSAHPRQKICLCYAAGGGRKVQRLPSLMTRRGSHRPSVRILLSAVEAAARGRVSYLASTHKSNVAETTSSHA